LKTLNQLARRYRQLCKGPSRVDQQINKLREQLSRLNQQRQKMLGEIEHTQLLLNYCVVSGESPAQAALSHTNEQMQAALEEHQRLVKENRIYYDPSFATINTVTISNHSHWTKPVSVTGGIASAGTITVNSGIDTINLASSTP
jgi:hypothetical protein